MSWLWRWGKRLLLATLLLVAGLLSPVLYVETMCPGSGTPTPYTPLLPVSDHRPEARTFLTYPEWHIVHAYEDYAEVIRTGDPHRFGYLDSIGGYWSSLCALTRTASSFGEVDGPTRQMVHVIGVSFTAEMTLKAAYEETVGRVVALLRGSARAPLDDLSARQAADYAAFLQQVPWYKWPFRQDAEALEAAATPVLRDRERRLALGLEYRAKAAYAGLIAQAVESTGQDQLTLRMVVTGADPARLAAYPDVTVIGASENGVVIETPRYRKLTGILQKMAADGLDFAEIAGNDDILFTLLSGEAERPDAFFGFARQGFGEYRHLIVVKVPDLAAKLRALAAEGAEVEHIHDY